MRTFKNFVEARDHAGNRTFNSYGGWRGALKKLWPHVEIQGDRDIAQAFVDKQGVGEWDGAAGTIYYNQPAVKPGREYQVANSNELGIAADHLEENPSPENKLSFLRAANKVAGKIEKVQVAEDFIQYTARLFAKQIRNAIQSISLGISGQINFNPSAIKELNRLIFGSLQRMQINVQDLRNQPNSAYPQGAKIDGVDAVISAFESLATAFQRVAYVLEAK